MFKIQKKFILFLLIILFFILSLLFYVKFTTNLNINKVDYGSNLTFHLANELSPYINGNQLSYLDKQIFYPSVRISPKNIIYPLINLTEEINLINNKYKPLYYAEKRVSEIQKWGNEFTIDSWEATLTKYKLLIDKEIIVLKGAEINNFIYLQYHLKNDQLIIESTILGLNTSEENKNILISLSSQIFSYLNTKIDKIVPAYNPFVLNYQLKDTIEREGFGYYNVTVNILNLPQYLKNSFELIIDNLKNSNQNYETHEGQSIEFQNIKIDSLSSLLTLKLKEFFIPIRNQEWVENFDNQSQLYFYTLIVPTMEKNNYLLNFNYKINDQTILRLEKIISDNGKVTNQVLFENFLFINKESLLKKIIRFDLDNNNFYRFVILSQKTISPNDLSQIYVEFLPISDPKITLEKIAIIPERIPKVTYKKINSRQYLITVYNTIADQEDLLYNSLKLWWKIISKKPFSNGYQLIVEFWPIKVSLYGLISSSLLFFLMICYLLLKKSDLNKITLVETIFTQLMSLVKKTFQSIFKKIGVVYYNLKQTLLRQTITAKFIILFSIILLIIFDLFILTESSIFIILLIMILFFLVSMGFRADKRIGFVVALIFLASCPLFLIFHKNALADRLAVWSFVFFLIGAIHSTLNLNE